MCRSPKNDWFQPVKGNQAIGAGTPTLMPIMPALKRCLNWRAVQPLRVKIEAPLPYGQSRPMSRPARTGSVGGTGPGGLRAEARVVDEAGARRGFAALRRAGGAEGRAHAF